MRNVFSATAALLMAGVAASAAPVLQFDVNGFTAQALNGAGANSVFTGVNHTGAVQFSIGSGLLNGIFIQSTSPGPFINAGFAGFTLTAFNGQVNLANGQVTGGSLTIQLNNNDQYTCAIKPGSGFVSTYVGGGFIIEALTNQGFFNDSQYGNVNVSPWFNSQGLAGLPGSFLQFNFNPTTKGATTADMDLFVDVVPLPSGVAPALATLSGLAVLRRLRRR